MSPNHTILSARGPKLEVATRRFWRGGWGGTPPLFFWRGLEREDLASVQNEKNFVAWACCNTKNTCFSACSKRAQKWLFLGPPRKTSKNVKKHVFRVIFNSDDHLVVKSQNRVFGQKLVHMGSIIIFGKTPKMAIFRPFLDPPDDPQKWSKMSTFGVHQNHYDKHVCESASYSSHVHHNYFDACIFVS